MPTAPRVGEDFMGFLGYWTALQSFLTYSFGWTRHDRGLRWWYDAGRPTVDPRLALINAVWERDGNLLPYTEWCHDRLSYFDHQALAEGTDYDPTPDDLSGDWTRTLAEVRGDQIPRELSPHGKHLEGGDHAAGPASSTYRGSIALIDRPARRAVYTCESVMGWYRGLVELSAELPELGDSSWHVDVYVRPIGFLGTYRQSRETGLWFAGQHRHHTVGN
ncbi:MAG: hypothetical protein JWQ12_1765 [Glaciihabitans sp.]|nr:hypothetical protein [Glaciihabitans sp.]